MFLGASEFDIDRDWGTEARVLSRKPRNVVTPVQFSSHKSGQRALQSKDHFAEVLRHLIVMETK